MRRETQLQNTGFSFEHRLPADRWVVEPERRSTIRARTSTSPPDGAYSSYNWELFFHAPLLIANPLSKNQRFEEARDWYHFIFNPIGVESAAGRLADEQVLDHQAVLRDDRSPVRPAAHREHPADAGGDTTVPGSRPAQEAGARRQVRDWRSNPFEPHRIANYRTVAYQKTVVMKYLDNLIAWGDYLFRQDSMESINEATQLYILAADLLGPRPKQIPPQASRRSRASTSWRRSSTRSRTRWWRWRTSSRRSPGSAESTTPDGRRCRCSTSASRTTRSC